MEIKFDFNNMFAPQIVLPYGIEENEIDKLSDRLQEAHNNITKKRKNGDLIFLNMPYDKNTVGQIDRIVQSKKGKFKNLITIAIGGSALGSITVFNALSNPYHNLLDSNHRNNTPRFFFPDNVDPYRISSLLDFINLKDTLINVISKSGGTVETIANFLIFRQKVIESVGKSSYKDHFIFTTSEKTNSEKQQELIEIARKEEIDTLIIPDNLGGRYSVLSPSGLLCAAFLGYDVNEFMAGARSMDKRLKKAEVWKNPAYLYSALHYIADQQKRLNIFVIMPYSHSLRTFADWYAQLIAESLGKKASNDQIVGPTPVKTLGVTDQHSQLQLYVQGKIDKVITFIAVKKFHSDITIPKDKDFDDYNSIKYLGGHTLNKLLDAERKGTESSLNNNNRLNCTITLPRITPYTLGQLFYFYEMAVIFLGELYKVNPLDQLGVEESKAIACSLMGRKGYEDIKKKVKRQTKKNKKYIF